ncbi:MAG: amidohydrolase [Vulcanimicrobiaceae bacterium]
MNARVYRFDSAERRWRRHNALAIEEGLIRTLDADEVGGGVDRVDLEGATVLPAFADCHVHLEGTGYFTGERSLAAVRSYAQYSDAIAHLPRDGAFLYAGQYDESLWHDGASADAQPLERIHQEARAMLVRIDGHSSIVNRATFAWLGLDPKLTGIECGADGAPTGRLFLDANWLAQAAFMAAFPHSMRVAAEARAIDLALSRGALHLHAQLMGLPRESYAQEVHRLRSSRAKVHPKICEPDAQLAVDAGLPYVGGDVFLDGSLGSCTAALCEPYTHDRGHGALRMSDDALLGYYAQAEALGIAAGVHAIGDAAIEQCIRTWERVLAGKPSQRGARHFIEHFEMADDEHIDACARMGIHLSMQPQFDATWGGEGGMYDERLGTQRKQRMNALARILRAGAVLCGGDDSPVCSLDPLAGMQACLDHHEPEQRLTANDALVLYTVNAARFGYVEKQTGNLAPGLAADLAVLDRDPFDGARFADCSVLQTWRDGQVAFDLNQ